MNGKFFFIVFGILTSFQLIFPRQCNAGTVPSTAHRARESEYDLNFYFLDLDIEDSSNFISGNVMIRGYALTNLDTFAVELDTTFTIDSVLANLNGTNYREATITRKGAELNVVLPFTVAAGEYTEVRIYYHGFPVLNDTSYVSGIYTTAYNERFSATEPYYAYTWFPCKQVLTDKADSVWFFITTDTSSRGISNGLLTRVSYITPTKYRWEWKSHHPIAFYLISFVVGKFTLTTDYFHPIGKTDSMQLQFYGNGYSSSFNNVKEILQIYTNLFGPYPFYDEKLGIAFVNQFWGGMENQTIISEIGSGVEAHEIAHQWFGDNVTCASFKDVMINEGFATWCEAVYAEFSGGGDSARILICNGFQASILREPFGSGYYPPDTTSMNGVFGNSSLYYDKNAMMINSLRFVINNDSLFFLGLRNYQNRFHGSNAYGSDLREVMENTTGIDLTDFFNQWYYGYGYPTFNIKWNQVGDRLMLKVTETTSCDSTPLFKTPLELMLFNGNSDTLVKLNILQNISSFNLPFTGTFNHGEIDPNQWIANSMGYFRKDTTLFVSDIKEEPVASKYKIYPNPTSGLITIGVGNGLGSMNEAVLYNSQGQVVYRTKDLITGQIDLSVLHDGFYLLQINQSDFSKVIIAH